MMSFSYCRVTNHRKELKKNQPFIISYKSVAQLGGSLTCLVPDDFGYTHLCVHLCSVVGGQRLHGLGWTWCV